MTLTNQSYGPVGVGLDGNGHVTPGKGNSGIVGVLIKNMPLGALVGSATLTGITAPGALAGDTVDVMTDGEIVDLAGFLDGNGAAFTAGTTYYADGTTGALVPASAQDLPPASGLGSVAGSVVVGFTVEATRLVVRVVHASKVVGS